MPFKNGYWKFYPKGENHGGFYYSGYLKDTAKDGNSVFVHGKVEGLGYGRKEYNKGGAGTSEFKDQLLYDPDVLYVSRGLVQACQDRGTLFSDLCDDTGWIERGSG